MYIVPSENMKRKLKETVEVFDGVKKFAQFANTKENNVRRWIRGDRSIPFKIAVIIAKSHNLSIWKFLDRERIKSMTSNNSFKVRVNIREIECTLLGWILTEGSLRKTENMICISQGNLEALGTLKKKIAEEFDMKSGLNIYPDKNSWKLVISIYAFQDYLVNRYEIPTGKKSRIIKVPQQIFSLPKEKKLAFLAGCLEGDGSFCTFLRRNKRGLYRTPRIALSSDSAMFLKGVKELLRGIDLDCTINPDKDKFKLNISKSIDCIKLFFEIIPYMIHQEKIGNFIKALSDIQTFNSVSMKNTRNLIQKWEKKLNLSWKDVIKLSEDICKYKATRKTVSNWGRPSNSPPLSIVVKACEDLNVSYFNYLPVWYSGILWVHNKISKGEFENFRGLKLDNLLTLRS